MMKNHEDGAGASDSESPRGVGESKAAEGEAAGAGSDGDSLGCVLPDLGTDDPRLGLRISGSFGDPDSDSGVLSEVMSIEDLNARRFHREMLLITDSGSNATFLGPTAIVKYGSFFGKLYSNSGVDYRCEIDGYHVANNLTFFAGFRDTYTFKLLKVVLESEDGRLQEALLKADQASESDRRSLLDVLWERGRLTLEQKIKLFELAARRGLLLRTNFEAFFELAVSYGRLSKDADVQKAFANMCFDFYCAKDIDVPAGYFEGLVVTIESSGGPEAAKRFLQSLTSCFKEGRSSIELYGFVSKKFCYDYGRRGSSKLSKALDNLYLQVNFLDNLRVLDLSKYKSRLKPRFHVQTLDFQLLDYFFGYKKSQGGRFKKLRDGLLGDGQFSPMLLSLAEGYEFHKRGLVSPGQDTVSLIEGLLRHCYSKKLKLMDAAASSEESVEESGDVEKKRDVDIGDESVSSGSLVRVNVANQLMELIGRVIDRKASVDQLYEMVEKHCACLREIDEVRSELKMPSILDAVSDLYRCGAGVDEVNSVALFLLKNGFHFRYDDLGFGKVVKCIGASAEALDPRLLSELARMVLSELQRNQHVFGFRLIKIVMEFKASHENLINFLKSFSPILVGTGFALFGDDRKTCLIPVCDVPISLCKLLDDYSRCSDLIDAKNLIDAKKVQVGKKMAGIKFLPLGGAEDLRGPLAGAGGPAGESSEVTFDTALASLDVKRLFELSVSESLTEDQVIIVDVLGQALSPSSKTFARYNLKCAQRLLDQNGFLNDDMFDSLKRLSDVCRQQIVCHPNQRFLMGITQFLRYCYDVYERLSVSKKTVQVEIFSESEISSRGDMQLSDLTLKLFQELGSPRVDALPSMRAMLCDSSDFSSSSAASASEAQEKVVISSDSRRRLSDLQTLYQFITKAKFDEIQSLVPFLGDYYDKNIKRREFSKLGVFTPADLMMMRRYGDVDEHDKLRLLGEMILRSFYLRCNKVAMNDLLVYCSRFSSGVLTDMLSFEAQLVKRMVRMCIWLFSVYGHIVGLSLMEVANKIKGTSAGRLFALELEKQLCSGGLADERKLTLVDGEKPMFSCLRSSEEFFELLRGESSPTAGAGAAARATAEVEGRSARLEGHARTQFFRRADGADVSREVSALHDFTKMKLTSRPAEGGSWACFDEDNFACYRGLGQKGS